MEAMAETEARQREERAAPEAFPIAALREAEERGRMLPAMALAMTEGALTAERPEVSSSPMQEGPGEERAVPVTTALPPATAAAGAVEAREAVAAAVVRVPTLPAWRVPAAGAVVEAPPV